MKRILMGLLLLLTGGCLGIPKGIKPVTSFDLDRYLGTWYEIARLDHRFERGLSRVTADYSIRDDGTIRVVNRGYAAQTGKWKQGEAKAAFAGSDSTGHLKVSFFGPFYGSYVIFDLSPNYQSAYVTSSSRSYLWYLSRTPTVSQADKDRFVAQAKSLGFATGGLIWVVQDEGKGGE